MRYTRWALWGLLGVSLLMLASCGGAQEKARLSGAGATFPLPYYQLAFRTYQADKGVEVSYGAIGSGGGIRSLKDRVVDFAASDAFLTDAELDEFPCPILHIPTCMGAVVLAYNLEGIAELNLDGALIAAIYLGQITQWNDPRIQALNPGVTLPDLPIAPVYRSDGSGTTFVFSHYMSAVSPTWAQELREGKALSWKHGVAGKGNPGVAALVASTQGAIGYVGSEYAFSLNMSYARLKNSAGNFVEPSPETIEAAASGEMPKDLRAMITNRPDPKAYPISCFTWLLLPQEQAYDKRTKSQAKATVALLRWMLGPTAQALPQKVHYAPLPESVAAQALALLDGVTYNGRPLE